jgi:CheY-like chemotaxis protein
MEPNSERNILIVDDGEIVRNTVAGYLRDLGYNVCVAIVSDHKEMESHADLAIVDLQLPDGC